MDRVRKGNPENDGGIEYTRLTGASKNTVAKLLKDAGEAFMAYHDANVRNVPAKRVQCDEIWSFSV